MSLAEGTGGNSSLGSMALGEALMFFGRVADYAAGSDLAQGEHIAALAVAMARLAEFRPEEIDALYFAARLRNLGVLGNAAFNKENPPPDRLAMMERWDIPADGARICEQLGALPEPCADIVRWQAECWDGTGFPDQLRWAGVPKNAQVLHVAATYASVADPEEAFAAVTRAAGQTFSPEQARTFVTWFHLCAGEIEPVEPPYGAIRLDRADVMNVLTLLATRVDAHNATPGRAQRIARRCEEIGAAFGLDAGDLRRVTLAALLFGIGELRAASTESQRFDALSRLGIDLRAVSSTAAADLIEHCETLRDVAPIVRARSEWYDGTGAPNGLRHDAIPAPSQVLAVAIAYDALDEAFRSRITDDRTPPTARLETVAGTQFDPRVVQALAQALKAHA